MLSIIYILQKAEIRQKKVSNPPFKFIVLMEPKLNSKARATIISYINTHIHINIFCRCSIFFYEAKNILCKLYTILVYAADEG